MGDAKKEPNYYPVKIRNFRHIFLQNILRLRIKRAKVFLATFTLFFLCTFNLQGSAWAADGDLDTTFSGDGKETTAIGSGTDTAWSVVLQSDGKIVAAGYSFNGSNDDFAVVRYNTNGSLDTTFDTDGIVTTAIGSGTDTAYSVVLQSDGKIVVAGRSSNGSNYDFAVVRYNTNGSLDTTFDTDGIVTTAIGSGTDIAYSVVLQSDGKIVAAGYSRIGSNNDFAVVRYNTNGSLDTTFDTDGIVTTAIGSGTDIAYSVVLQSDGKIVAAGHARFGNDDFAVVRYNTNGLLDTTFSGDGIVTTAIGSGTDGAYSVKLQSDGKIVAAGYSNNGINNDFAVVRYNTDGSLDTTFDTDGIVTTAIGLGDDIAHSVVLQSDGKIVAAGYSDNGSYFDFAVVRYTTNGSLDTTFDTDGIVTTAIGSVDDVAYSVKLQSDGKIVATGYSYNGSNHDFAVVRYNTNGSLDTTFDTDGKVTTAIGSGSDEAYSVVLQSDGKIVAAGYSNNGINNDFAVVRYNTNGSLDTTFDTNGIQTTAIGSVDDVAHSVVLQSDGKIVVAGYSDNGSNFDFAVVRYNVVKSNTDGSLSWVGAQSISCPAPNPWVKEKLGFASNAKPVLVSAENTVGKTITQGAYDSLKSSGVEFDTVTKKVSTATETLALYGCKDKLLSGKVNQPIQFIAGGYTLQSDAHGYINTSDLKWHDTNGVTLYTNTAAFMHTIKFTKTGKYVVVLTEQPDTSRGLIPTYGVRSVRFVININ